ncbi:hypothetical protein CGRA01v4_01147 [Colletotrichum graminicola]|nr:hypothetical protein CGRA01v4_01147 [Colletotrichum graminicola]
MRRTTRTKAAPEGGSHSSPSLPLSSSSSSSSPSSSSSSLAGTAAAATVAAFLVKDLSFLGETSFSSSSSFFFPSSLAAAAAAAKAVAAAASSITRTTPAPQTPRTPTAQGKAPPPLPSTESPGMPRRLRSGRLSRAPLRPGFVSSANQRIDFSSPNPSLSASRSSSHTLCVDAKLGSVDRPAASTRKPKCPFRQHFHWRSTSLTAWRQPSLRRRSSFQWPKPGGFGKLPAAKKTANPASRPAAAPLHG